MIRQVPNERCQSVEEVIQALAEIPTIWLLAGEETTGDVGGRMFSHINSTRLIENAQNALIQTLPETVLNRLSELERKLERLGPFLG